MPERQPLPPRDYLDMGHLRDFSESIENHLVEAREHVNRINRSLEESSTVRFSGEVSIICERSDCEQHDETVRPQESVPIGQEMLVEGAKIIMVPNSDEPEFDIDPETNTPVFCFYVELEPVTDLDCEFYYTGIIQRGADKKKSNVRLLYD